MRDDLSRGTRIRCALDARERPLHCHQEKTIVIDDRVAFVGGIDLTSEAGDRFDTSAHRARGRLARREHPHRGARGRGRRRALSHPLARSQGMRSARLSRLPPRVTSIFR